MGPCWSINSSIIMSREINLKCFQKRTKTKIFYEPKFAFKKQKNKSWPMSNPVIQVQSKVVIKRLVHRGASGKASTNRCILENVSLPVELPVEWRKLTWPWLSSVSLLVKWCVNVKRVAGTSNTPHWDNVRYFCTLLNWVQKMPGSVIGFMSSEGQLEHNKF